MHKNLDIICQTLSVEAMVGSAWLWLVLAFPVTPAGRWPESRSVALEDGSLPLPKPFRGRLKTAGMTGPFVYLSNPCSLFFGHCPQGEI